MVRTRPFISGGAREPFIVLDSPIGMAATIANKREIFTICEYMNVLVATRRNDHTAKPPRGVVGLTDLPAIDR